MSPGSFLNSGVASGLHIFGAMLVDGSSKPKWLRTNSCTAVCSSRESPSLRTHVDLIDLSVDFSYLSQAWSAVWAVKLAAERAASRTERRRSFTFPGLRSETWGTRD